MCWPGAGGSVSMSSEQEDVGSKQALKGPGSKGKLRMFDIAEERKTDTYISQFHYIALFFKGICLPSVFSG